VRPEKKIWEIKIEETPPQMPKRGIRIKNKIIFKTWGAKFKM
jgi:hypothetical protein